MSRKDAVLIASRVLAVYFSCWVLTDVMFLPTRLISVLHYINSGSVLTGPTYSFKYYLSELIVTLLRILLFTGAGWFFYRCGSRVQALLLPLSDSEEAPLSAKS
jgi:hypothetical protein